MALCTDLNNGVLSKIARCLINTLLNLAAAALAALKQVLIGLLALLDAKIAELIIMLAQYDLLHQQYKLIEAALRAALDEIQSKLNGLPLGLLDKSCLEWAGLNGSINDFINNELRPPIDQILFEIERITSFQSELAALKSAYEALKAFFLGIIDLLEVLILERKCMEAAGITAV